MRRFRESGIVTILLLGLTGCAGVQQRLGWTEPPYLGEEATEDRPLSRLAFWRQHRAEEANPADLNDAGGRSLIASADDEEARPGLLRRLPMVSRLWKGGDRDESRELDMPAARYAPGMVNNQSVVLNARQAPAVARAAAETGGGASVADAKPASTEATPTRTPAIAVAAADRPAEPMLRELSVDLAGTKPQVDPAAVPAGNPGSPSNAGGPAGEAAPPIPAVSGTQVQPPMLSEPPPVASIGREAAPAQPTAKPGAQPSAATPDLMPATSDRGTSVPSPSVTAPADAGGSTSGITSTPGPIMPATEPVILSGSSQSVVMSSSQGGYISGGCEASCGPKCKIHKLCPFKKHKKAMASSVVYPSAQGVISSCESSAPCKVKKPCFLKTWLHHKSGCKSKGCKGCKSCTYCGEPAMMVSAQSPMVSPQW